MLSLIASSLILAAPASEETLPWFLRLGESAMQLRARVSVIPQVVLVPDLATLAAEVAEWTPEAQWPVLIEDDVLTPLFVARFGPKAIYRRKAVDSLPEQSAQWASAIESAAAAAWNAAPGVSVRQAAASAGLPVPPGLIISRRGDPAAAAALLLSAGRGQDIAWVDLAAGTPNQALGLGETTALAEAVAEAAAATSANWDALGDDLDAITICRSMAGRGHTDAAVPIESEAGGVVAMTDVLGRTATGARWAFAGWIFGDAARAAWMANCSLFLPRIDAWLCGTYPDATPWTHWSMTPANETLTDAGFKVTMRTQETLRSLVASDMTGLGTDLALMNTKGNADFFQMAGGAQADPGDVPILTRPAALGLTHSWSLRSPASSDTVGGRWLDRGVYAMVGSSAEPQLQAFVPPALLSKRLAGGVPLLVAARWWPDATTPMNRTWRITTIGDPLMIIPPPRGTIRRPAELPPARPELVGLHDSAVAAMKQAESAPSDEAFAAAIGDLALMGRREMAIKMWAAARQADTAGPRSARAAFPLLFASGERDAMLHAWARLGGPTPRQGDMLWAAFGPTLGEGTSEAALSALTATLSPGGAVDRVRRLAPLLARRWGRSAALASVESAASMATTTRQRREIEAIRQEIGQ